MLKYKKKSDKIRLLQQPYKQYEWQGEVLKRKGRIVVGKQQEVRSKLLAYFHEFVLGGNIVWNLNQLPLMSAWLNRWKIGEDFNMKNTTHLIDMTKTWRGGKLFLFSTLSLSTCSIKQTSSIKSSQCLYTWIVISSLLIF